MFEPKQLHQLARKHSKLLNQLELIKIKLADRFSTMSDPVEALILAVACGEPLLFVGPPGTGKSRLIRSFCVLTGLLGSENMERSNEYFEYLLTPFTEPGELFGFWDIASASKGEMKRMDKNMMQQATVVYLDEVFNGSSAILNSILTFMNERLFHDRGEAKRVKMECLFGATNHVPETPELRAISDRFIIRCRAENSKAQRDPLRDLMAKGWKDTYGKSLEPLSKTPSELFKQLALFREDVHDTVREPLLSGKWFDKNYGTFAAMIATARNQNLSDMSNRRMIKLAHAMLVDRLMFGTKNNHDLDDYTKNPLGPDQFKLLPRFFLDKVDFHGVNALMTQADDIHPVS